MRLPVVLWFFFLLHGLVESDNPNFVIILADDLGYNDLSGFGSPTVSTPHLDRLMSEGMRFTQFYAAPLCTPSRGALMTGKLPIRIGLYTNLSYPNDNDFRVFYPTSVGCLPKSELTIPEYLKEWSNGKYWNGFIGKSHLGSRYDRGCLPLQRGFDAFYGLPYSHEEGWPTIPEGWLWPPVPLFDGNEIIEQPVNLSSLTPRYNAKILDWLNTLAASRQPFFLHIAYEQPHVPLFVTPEFKSASIRGLYGDAVAEMDASIGLILDKLDATGLASNTFVFFASDNGAWINPSCGVSTSMFSGCAIEPQDGGSNGQLFDGKGSTYEGGERVLAMVKYPGFVTPGTISRSVASMYDILPTIAELAFPFLARIESLDGYSLVPMLTGKNMTSPHSFMHFWRENVLYAIRYNEYKCHWYTRPGFGSEPPLSHDPCLLFQLNQDPGEKFPLNPADYADVITIMNQEYTEHTTTIVKGVSQFNKQNWTLAPCCNGTISLRSLEQLAKENVTGFDAWQQLGCVC